MRLDVVTIFPEYLEPLNVSLVGKARARGQLDVRVHDLRAWTYDRHHTVDDTPYGGGPGMVMKPEPWGEALDEIIASGRSASDAGPWDGTSSEVADSGDADQTNLPTLVVPTPSGRPFTQELAAELATKRWLVFTPARYEGIDRRVIEEYGERTELHEVSIGDYVLAGGEAPVLVIVEAVARLLPGVLGNAQSHRDDSFAPGSMSDLLEGPVYTKPPEWRGRGIPEVLLSGHHERIARWRRDQALLRTRSHRPDLIERCDPDTLDRHDLATLAESATSPVREPRTDSGGHRPEDEGRFGGPDDAVEE
ncbi:tRNA (guanosine(37)-N1)-methyltransferase TrmD [Streptomyces oceani]|uniref:tRNA (guanine-N(1)-)-methyltransferase n=1 Tax=Streptomyces oceani TaxID=1075402 RepID=A0A1E7JRH9_9ACTN|nr:tRNA (guanosine(37)-N1)-methyltransferase TrmD [Streptomyces oceani]OEU91397.1 tRNA (guanine-N1)-methyltransferase [Streptomyces oceani]